ncbi:hypothetical protein B0T25DRAFT_270818 [Lasiosphaeria hispida]|uniref:Uncharacterized protein n=1 Tax=Lasiosphaeria hispida TaxID=260671 RepID=A0AAJ0MAS5_9PEZI|nr:hypothetical protein B0T25DRAFT_270818 [Lasiosphaeria hispida]
MRPYSLPSALRPLRTYATGSRSRLKPALSLEHVRPIFTQSRGRKVELTKPDSSSSGRESCHFTEPHSEARARYRTRRRKPRRDGLCGRSLRDIAESQTLFVPCCLLSAAIRTDTNKSHIRYLLSTGKTEWEGMERYISGL